MEQSKSQKGVLILGAGLAGLACALELSRSPYFKITLLEKQPQVGGLAKSIQRDGFVFDLGPHRFHTRKKWILKWIAEVLKGLDTEMIRKERVSRIFLKRRFFDWPLNFSQALKTMPIGISLRAGLDYLRADFSRKLGLKRQESSYEDWVKNRFGQTLYQIFFADFNQKLWGIPCHKISTDWAIQRISLPNLKEAVLQSLFKKRRQARTNVARFYYPERGGIGQLSGAIAQGFQSRGGCLMRNFRIQELRLHSKGGELVGILKGEESGFERKKIEFDLLISSIPLTSLARYLETPDMVKEASRRLKFRGLIFVCLLLNRPRVSRDHWIYFPEEDVVFNRFSEPKNFSSYNAPLNQTSLCVEISCQAGDKMWSQSDSEIIQRVAQDLCLLKLVRKEDIARGFVAREPHAYPIYDLNYQENLKVIKEYLEKRHIILIGRNGIFQYNNMDHSLGTGIKTARALVSGEGVKKAGLEDQYLR